VNWWSAWPIQISPRSLSRRTRTSRAKRPLLT